MKDLTEAEGATRGEKKEIAGNVLKSVEEKNKAASAAAGAMYGHQLTAETQRQDARLREEGANKRSAAQIAVERERLEFDKKYKDLTTAEIMEKAKNDPNFLNNYAKVKSAMSGLGSKMDMAGANAMLRSAEAAYKAAQANSAINPDGVADALKDYQEARDVVKRISRGEEAYPKDTTATLPPLVPKDKGSLVVGKKYSSPDGRVGTWNGKTFVAE